MSNLFDTEERYPLVLWSAEWCGPCRLLKNWIRTEKINENISNFLPNVDEKQCIVFKSVPTLQDGGVFITGVQNIKNYLVEYE